MTEQKHTPGPWEWSLGEWGYSGLWNPETRQEVITTGGRNEGDYPVTWMGEEMLEADARLIAAAPDLLAALKMVMQHGRIDNSELRMNQVAAAITKAEGKE